MWALTWASSTAWWSTSIPMTFRAEGASKMPIVPVNTKKDACKLCIHNSTLAKLFHNMIKFEKQIPQLQRTVSEKVLPENDSFWCFSVRFPVRFPIYIFTWYTQEYFTYMTPASIIVGGKQAMPVGKTHNLLQVVARPYHFRPEGKPA